MVLGARQLYNKTKRHKGCGAEFVVRFDRGVTLARRTDCVLGLHLDGRRYLSTTLHPNLDRGEGDRAFLKQVGKEQ